MITKDLGIATAYGYALSKGYTGTEEEFATLMASYATTAQTAVEAAERAVAAQGAAELAQGKAEDAQGVAEGKATEASGSANSASADALKAEGLAVGQQNGTDVGSGSPYYHANAKYYKEQASNSATTASNKAGEAAQSATDASNAKTAAQTAKGKAEDAQTAAETAQGKAEDAQEAAEQAAEQAEQTLNSYAHVDGYYEQMTVGNAEQLVSTVGVEDKVPYLFRTSGGSADIGNRENDMVVGGTVAWNQQLTNGNFADSTGWAGSNASVTIENNSAYIHDGTSGCPGITTPSMKMVAAHKYLYTFEAKGASGGESLGMNNLNGFNSGFATLTASKARYSKITTATSNQTRGFVLFAEGISSSFYLYSVNVFDLTQMFGSTIADYIYSLETATPGAGVSYFRKLFPSPYYAYTPGELMSVQTSAHRMVGFNAWDEVWELGRLNYDKTSPTWGQNVSTDNQIRSKNYIPVVPNTTYYCTGATGSTIYAIFYDADKNPVEYNNSGYGSVANANFTTPSNAHFMRFYVQGATTYANNICINLSWDGERDGEYEPYTVHSYALDSDLVLRGIPKLDANNALFYDGDTYESDGTVTRRYGVVDLCTLTWTKDDTQTSKWRFSAPLGVKKTGQGDTKSNMVCTKYDAVSPNATYTGTMGVSTNSFKDGNVFVCDMNYSDAAAFKTAMSGVYLVYELATPTTESADTYQNPQIVDDFGTEEYTDTRAVAIPVGHVTEYQNNLRAKLEMSPESPSGDGDYIVRQTNGQNAYVPLSFPADELPAPPTSNGNYMLKCAVSGGTATYTWESIT